jgi:hypothetical protein
MYVPRPPHFSEFSYGFAVTREFVAAEGENIRIAPVFPSLLAEAGLGWDVLLERSGMPMFLQFKLSDCMKGPRAMEAKRGDFAPPFFRFHLRCGKDMNQHSLLVELNNRGENVRYIAPAFYLSDDLNEAYRTNTVVDQSIQIAPNQIGNLPVGRHHVTFSRSHGAVEALFGGRAPRNAPRRVGTRTPQECRNGVSFPTAIIDSSRSAAY